MAAYRTGWLFRGVGEPIRDGVLTVENGLIASCTKWEGQPVDADLGSTLVIPGLVNAHTHLDLGGVRNRLPRPGSFTSWLAQVVQYRRDCSTESQDAVIRGGIEESIRSGTTLIGDISSTGRSLELLGQSRLRGVVYLELIGLAMDRAEAAWARYLRWLETPGSGGHKKGISPHAPYSVGRALLKRLSGSAEARSCPVAMHVAESEAESALLGRQTDEFVSFLQSINAWSPSELCKSMDEVLELLNGFDRPVLVHGNYLTQHQWRKLKAGSSVVYCPRTHEYFGHRPHRYLEMAADGVNVALGTDSLASNPDLSVLNEARFLWRRDRSRLTGPGLLRMAARNGAAVLDYDEGGTLEVGKRADFVVLPCPGPANDPWEQLFGEETAPAAVYVGGLRVYPS